MRRRQRPVRQNAGAVASLATLATLLAGCGASTVHVETPALHGAAAADCARLVRALPHRVADQPRRQVEPAGVAGAAWGDPAIVLRCGVPRPKELRPTSTCQMANGVGWFIPESQIQGRPTDIVMTTVGRAENVEVRLPEKYWPPAAAMVDLAPAIKKTIREVRPCL